MYRTSERMSVQESRDGNTNHDEQNNKVTQIAIISGLVIFVKLLLKASFRGGLMSLPIF